MVMARHNTLVTKIYTLFKTVPLIVFTKRGLAWTFRTIFKYWNQEDCANPVAGSTGTVFTDKTPSYCPACQTYEIETRFWVVVICPIIKCFTVLAFSFILFDLCLFITIFNFILNYVLGFWIFTYHRIWILLIIYCFKWNYWIIYFLTSLEVFWSVVS